jgi:hypothetical protein
MVKRWIVNALAKAFVSGEATADAIVERSATLLGRRWRWLRPLAVRYLEAMAADSHPRLRDAASFLRNDESFRKASWRHRRKLKIENWLQEPPRMEPVAAAEHWGLPRLETPGELANWLEVSVGDLEWFADLKGLGRKEGAARLRHYSYRVLRKDAASVRLIEAPKRRLKALQWQILSGILELIPVHDAAHGFRKGRSIQTFCAPHVGQRVVLKMDLRDFFPAISGARIQGLFRTMGYPEAVADLLAGLCTNVTPREIWNDEKEKGDIPGSPPQCRRTDLAGASPFSLPSKRTFDGADWDTIALYARRHLPQGAPTSPTLANLCAYHADCRLLVLAAAVGARYTRYADDVAFSGDTAFARCAEELSIRIAAILTEEGFAVYHRKTRIMRQSVRQHLAGLLVNERLNVRRTDFDELKAILTNCVRHGAASQNRLEHPDFRAHLQGRLAFVASVHDGRGRKLERLFEQIKWD